MAAWNLQIYMDYMQYQFHVLYKSFYSGLWYSFDMLPQTNQWDQLQIAIDWLKVFDGVLIDILSLRHI